MKIFHPTTLTEQPKTVKTQAAAVPSQGPTFELTGICLGPKTGTGMHGVDVTRPPCKSILQVKDQPVGMRALDV